MVATGSGHIQRLCWDGSINYSYCVDLRRVPFCDDQLVMKGKFVKPCPRDVVYGLINIPLELHVEITLL